MPENGNELLSSGKKQIKKIRRLKIIEIPDDNSIVRWKKNDKDEWQSAEISDLIKAYGENEKLDKLEKRVKQLEEIILNLTYDNSIKQICVYKKADNYYIKIPLHRYIHDYYEEAKNG